MIIKLISCAFGICIVLTYILVYIFRPNSIWFLPSILLQFISFCSMVVCTLILSKIMTSNTLLVLYFLSFLSSYFVLFLLIWNIHLGFSGNIFVEILNIHKGKDFFILPLPYIISNLIILIYIVLNKK